MGATLGHMKVVQRTPAEAWGTMWDLALRIAPVRWMFGALLLPGTPASAAVAALSVAAWEDLDSGA